MTIFCECKKIYVLVCHYVVGKYICELNIYAAAGIFLSSASEDCNNSINNST